MSTNTSYQIIEILSRSLNCDELEHVCTVAGNFKHDIKISVVALLHDYIEDGYGNFEETKKRFDLDDEQMAALDAITRRDGERYFTYIKRCKQNEMAKAVKLADLTHNINRCGKDLPNRWSMICRYAKAYGILIGQWRESKR